MLNENVKLWQLACHSVFQWNRSEHNKHTNFSCGQATQIKYTFSGIIWNVLCIISTQTTFDWLNQTVCYTNHVRNSREQYVRSFKVHESKMYDCPKPRLSQPFLWFSNLHSGTPLTFSATAPVYIDECSSAAQTDLWTAREVYVAPAHSSIFHTLLWDDKNQQLNSL